MDILFGVGVTILALGIVLGAILVRGAVQQERNVARNWRQILREYDEENR